MECPWENIYITIIFLGSSRRRRRKSLERNSFGQQCDLRQNADDELFYEILFLREKPAEPEFRTFCIVKNHKSLIYHFLFVKNTLYWWWILSEKKDRKSTRLNSSHVAISYAVFCLKKKNTK